MIINASRANFFLKCRRLQWWYNQRLTSRSLTQPLTLGSAYHKGCAVLNSGGGRVKALAAAETLYREELAKTFILPEEKPIHERNIELVKRMLNAQANQSEQDTWTVLKPEVEFCVDLPHTEHHCLYVHRILYPDDKRTGGHLAEDCRDFRCVMNHKVRGRTDGVLQWNSLIWILERKTSGMKQEIWWDQWYLALQISCYVWGVRKATGLPINGVLMEKSPKPAKNQNPFDFDYSPEREPYLRSEDDLGEFQDEMARIARDFEGADGAEDPFREFYRNTQSCMSYNRRCDFWDVCKRNGVVQPGEFRTRELDYVELEYYKHLGLPAPKPAEGEVPITDVDDSQ